jgi:hypothetical protein
MANLPTKLQQIGLLWFLALGMSAALVAAGRRWPDPLTLASGPIWTLLLLPPLAMALWLLGGWSLPPAGQEGQSEAPTQEQQR